MAMEPVTIREGSEYLYQCGFPTGCAGGRYKVHKFVLDVPSYQHKVLVECLEGKDKGLWFVCSLANFSYRYRLAPAEKE